MMKGFTLIEALLYIAIASAIAIAALQGFELFDAVHERHSAVAHVDTEAAFLAGRFSDALRIASASAPGPQEETPILELADGAMVSLQGTTVVVDRSDAPPADLTSSRVAVTDLSFRNLAEPGTPDIIRVRFTMLASPSIPSAGASYSHDYLFTIGIR
jgi:hypothetical protein